MELGLTETDFWDMSITAFNACIDAWKGREIRAGRMDASALTPAPAADRAAHESFTAFIRQAKTAAAARRPAAT